MRFQVRLSLLVFVAAAAPGNLCLGAPPVAGLSARYQGELDALRAGTTRPIAGEVAASAASSHWVLVDGILGDLARNLYGQVIPVLENEVGTGPVTVLRPSSLDALDVNADALARSFEDENRRTGKRLVILAHSRGAAETLLALLRHPSLVESGILESVVLVQGAFSGSPLATVVRDQVRRLCEKYLEFFFADAGCAAFGLFQDSIRTLVPADAIRLRESAAARLSPAQRQRIASVVSFVRGRAGWSGVRTQLKPGGLYLTLFHGENDGVLLTDHQQVEGLGTDLGVLETDHFGLLGTSPRADDDSPRAFTRALLTLRPRGPAEFPAGAFGAAEWRPAAE